MYSELFDQLGASGRLNRDSGNNANSSDEPLVSFKAGKMELMAQAPASYKCTPDKTRGEVRLVWKNRSLQWEWYSRREKKVMDSFPIAPSNNNSTFSRVEAPALQEKQHKNDRIYVWTRFQKKEASGEEEKQPDYEPEYHMYWMQDASDEKDEEIVQKVNQYLKDPKSAAPEGETPTDRMDTSDTAAAAPSSSSNNNEATTTANQSQVDALSSILENLGMPQGAASPPSSSGGGGGGNNATAPTTSTLTLADLQGAMAGIQPQPAATPTSLAHIVTPQAITELLADADVRARLLELLPEEQRNEAQLEENVRSPQVQQTLRSLTATLLPDDAGDLTGLYSVLANFQLDPADGQQAIAVGNPIQAFLDALLKKVQKEQADKKDDDEEAKQEESKE